MLTSLGYQTITAANGIEALSTIEKDGNLPDLLITDVVLPGMSGKELADKLMKIKPDLKILFMSGYTESTTYLHEVLEPGFPFIQKPFSKKELAVMVRQLLNKKQTH